MIKIVKVEASSDYRLYIKFADELEGEIDLSDLAGKGVFRAWSDADCFKRVSISRDRTFIRWGREIDIGADTLYMRLTGMTPPQLYPSLANELTHA